MKYFMLTKSFWLLPVLTLKVTLYSCHNYYAFSVVFINLYIVYFIFTAMFTSGLREKDASVVKLQGICPTVMGKLLNFIYTGEIVINQLVVCQLLPAASMLQV